MLQKLPEYRKGIIALVAALVTIANLAGFPVAADVPDAVIGLFDAVSALLVVRVPNRPPA